MTTSDGTFVLQEAFAPERAFVPATITREGDRFAQWSRRYVAVLACHDLWIGLLAATIGGYFSGTLKVVGFTSIYLLIGCTIAWVLGVATARGYERKQVGVGGDEVRSVLRGAVYVVVISAFISALFDPPMMLIFVCVGTPVAVSLSILVRFLARKLLHRRQAAGTNVRHVLVVGSPDAAADLCDALDRETQAGMRVVGVCVPANEISYAEGRGLRVAGDLTNVPAVARRIGCDAVAVSSGDSSHSNFLRELAWSLEGVGVELLVQPGLVEVAGPRMHIRPHVGVPLLHIEQPYFTGWRRIVKRATDIALTSVGLVLIAPLLLVIAVMIKLTDRGPVLFRQTRVGLDGSTFTMLKFRSMVVDAEDRLAELQALNEGAGPLFKMVNDPRITGIGRFLRRYSLDELPQLFNVLAGSMSLVGPRPPLQSEVDDYARDARRRLLVKPGLTGLWQVSGRSMLSWEETVRLDLRYVENWTLTFDLLIMWKTVFAVLARRGAY